MVRQVLDIVYEDRNLLVVNKPPGLLTSTNARERRPTLLAMVREHVAKQRGRHQVGVIHRLDRDASGLLVFSKNHQAYLSLKNQLFKRTMKRVYLAVVKGTPNPKEGRIESWLMELPDGKVVSTQRRAAGERAITDYELVARSGGKSLVRMTLLTGRKHQIRAHLSERGHPIVGDRMYGGASSRELMLCAVELAFADPVNGRLRDFHIDPPWQFLASDI
ncbi:MAG TPA: RluA family pseudouridine synthase [Tepidisphaeraceae bacterium]|nr:RluA family pseudouridine synthase [Tepidisphaeraceae bacterium]